jgi:hypothetical protein
MPPFLLLFTANRYHTIRRSLSILCAAFSPISLQKLLEALTRELEKRCTGTGIGMCLRPRAYQNKPLIVRAYPFTLRTVCRDNRHNPDSTLYFVC